MSHLSYGSESFFAKYSDNRRGFGALVDKQVASNTWSGIVASTPLIQIGMHIVVEDGKSTSFWHDTWLRGRDVTLVSLIRCSPPAFELIKTVGNHWLEDR